MKIIPHHILLTRGRILKKIHSIWLGKILSIIDFLLIILIKNEFYVA